MEDEIQVSFSSYFYQDIVFLKYIQALYLFGMSVCMGQVHKFIPWETVLLWQGLDVDLICL